MTRSTILQIALCLVIAATPVLAQTLQISLGTRETGTTMPIGGDGGGPGSLEWVAKDIQTLTLDGTWQTFTFDMDVDPISAFTGNGMLDGTKGVLEHIRILNSGGITLPIKLYIDDVTDTVTSLGAVNFGDFESFVAGDEVIFQEPSFSGSTGGNLSPAPDFAGVDDTVALNGSKSYRLEFQFVDGTITRWLRLTTSSALNIPNPTIAYDDDSVVTFAIMGAVPTIPFDHTISCVPTGPTADAVVDIQGGNPGSSVYLAMTVNNAGTGLTGWLFGIDITLQEIQAQINVGNPWLNVLDASGSFNIALPLGIPCPVGITLDAVPLEYAPFTGVLTQAGPAHTWML